MRSNELFQYSARYREVEQNIYKLELLYALDKPVSYVVLFTHQENCYVGNLSRPHIIVRLVLMKIMN